MKWGSQEHADSWDDHVWHVLFIKTCCFLVKTCESPHWPFYKKRSSWTFSKGSPQVPEGIHFYWLFWSVLHVLAIARDDAGETRAGMSRNTILLWFCYFFCFNAILLWFCSDFATFSYFNTDTTKLKSHVLQPQNPQCLFEFASNFQPENF